jgi:hypothetical protein
MISHKKTAASTSKMEYDGSANQGGSEASTSKKVDGKKRAVEDDGDGTASDEDVQKNTKKKKTQHK